MIGRFPVNSSELLDIATRVEGAWLSRVQGA